MVTSPVILFSPTFVPGIGLACWPALPPLALPPLALPPLALMGRLCLHHDNCASGLFALIAVRILGRAVGGVKLLQRPETPFRLTAGIL